MHGKQFPAMKTNAEAVAETSGACSATGTASIHAEKVRHVR
jgi:hypothetical protein